MKLITSVHIDTVSDLKDEPVYERLELFDFETIELTSSMQDVRDIGSVFTDFSQQFTIPASQVNNRILNHFYNMSITNGFDARVKRNGFISLNGVKFRQGYIRLSEATLRNGKPFSYSITFFGAIVTLKDLFGVSEIKDLVTLSKYNHDYTINNVYNGFRVGLSPDSNGVMQQSTIRDIVYPSISVENKWFYDTSGVAGQESDYNQGLQKNLWSQGTSSATGIGYEELKPALKIKRILEAIEESYASITFSDDFFSDVDFNNLYMLLHNKKGGLTNSTSGAGSERVFWLSTGAQGDYTQIPSDGTDVLPVTTNTTQKGGYSGLERNAQITTQITANSVTGGGDYTVEVLDADNNVRGSRSFNGTGTNSFSFILSSTQEKVWILRTRIKSEGELLTFTLKTFVQITQEDVQENQFGEEVLVTNFENAEFQTKQGTMQEEVIIYNQLPKITIIDLLKGLFNMFNLTASVEDGIIVVKTLNQFYFDGADLDLSDELDSAETTVKRSELYSNIDFKYSEPKTFGIINQNNITQDNFGNLQFQATTDGKNGSLVFDGGKYEIKLPFERLLFERLSDEADLDADKPPFSHGWLVDEDESPTVTKPVLFFNISTPVNTGDFQIGFKTQTSAINQYNRASNSTANNSKSLSFGEEIDEFTGLSVDKSLFNLFYRDYVSNLFKITSRLVTFNAILKLKTLLSYKMNDRITINGMDYRINTIKTNLTSGKTSMELLTDFSITSAILSSDVTDPSVPTDLAVDSAQGNSLNISWTHATDNVNVTGYKVFLNNVLKTTTGYVDSLLITGLIGSTTYSITISAIDAAGNESAKSTAVSGTTTSSADTSPPEEIDDLTLNQNEINDDGFRINWTEPFDNVGVTGYDIFLNQSFYQSIGAVSTFLFEGLDGGTQYTVAMVAKDAAGNESGISNIINATTDQ